MAVHDRPTIRTSNAASHRQSNVSHYVSRGEPTPVLLPLLLFYCFCSVAPQAMLLDGTPPAHRRARQSPLRPPAHHPLRHYRPEGAPLVVLPLGNSGEEEEEGTDGPCADVPAASIMWGYHVGQEMWSKAGTLEYGDREQADTPPLANERMACGEVSQRSSERHSMPWRRVVMRCDVLSPHHVLKALVEEMSMPWNMSICQPRTCHNAARGMRLVGRLAGHATRAELWPV